MVSKEAAAVMDEVQAVRRKMDLADMNIQLHGVVTKWLRKHGKGFKPKLTNDQREDLATVFKLMDEDGSGAIDADELGSAFQMLGFNLKKHEVLQFMQEVDHDGTGELEYNEFLEVMTESLARLSERMLDTHQNHTQVPLSLMTTAYKRKKLLKNIFANTPESLAQVVQCEQDMAAEAQGRADKAKALAEARAHKLEVCGPHSPALLRVSQKSNVNPGLLTNLSPDELRVVASLIRDDRKPAGSQDAKLQARRRLSELQGSKSVHLPPLAQQSKLLRGCCSDLDFAESPRFKHCRSLDSLDNLRSSKAAPISHFAPTHHNSPARDHNSSARWSDGRLPIAALKAGSPLGSRALSGGLGGGHAADAAVVIHAPGAEGSGLAGTGNTCDTLRGRQSMPGVAVSSSMVLPMRGSRVTLPALPKGPLPVERSLTLDKARLATTHAK